MGADIVRNSIGLLGAGMLRLQISTRHVDGWATQWRRLSGEQDAGGISDSLCVCVSFVGLLNARSCLCLIRMYFKLRAMQTAARPSNDCAAQRAAGYAATH